MKYGWEMIDRASYGSLAAIITEPIPFSGGMLTLPPGYIKAMHAQCDCWGMLFIIDEAQTGIGNCGDMLHSSMREGTASTAAWRAETSTSEYISTVDSWMSGILQDMFSQCGAGRAPGERAENIGTAVT